jgi:hypothetical protein
LTRGGDANGAGVGAEGTVVEFGKLANAAANACTDGKRPQDAPLAKLKISAVPSSLKALDVPLRSSRKEKEFVEVTLTGQFCFTLWQVRVLSQLARGERAQRHNRDPRFGGQSFQSLRSCGLLLGDRQASEAAKADGGYSSWLGRGSLWPQVKIVFGKENTAAIFGDKRVCVS